jgi:hypothetical protein
MLNFNKLRWIVVIGPDRVTGKKTLCEKKWNIFNKFYCYQRTILCQTVLCGKIPTLKHISQRVSSIVNLCLYQIKLSTSCSFSSGYRQRARSFITLHWNLLIVLLQGVYNILRFYTLN